MKEFLYRNKNIKEVAIISSPDQRKGEIVMAAIVLKDGIQTSAEEIISWSRENMSAYKIPRKISFMNSLPKKWKRQNPMARTSRFRVEELIQ